MKIVENLNQTKTKVQHDRWLMWFFAILCVLYNRNEMKRRWGRELAVTRFCFALRNCLFSFIVFPTSLYILFRLSWRYYTFLTALVLIYLVRVDTRWDECRFALVYLQIYFLYKYISSFVTGIKEPVYDLEKFLTPNQKKRLQVKEVFANKYKNM